MAVSPRRILFVTGEYPPRVGGVADHVVRLRAALEDLGVNTRVATESVSGDSQLERVHRASPRPWGRQILKVLRLVKRFRSDVVHIQYQAGAFDSPVQSALLPLALRLSGYGGVIVVTFHDLAEPYVFPLAGPLRRWSVHLLRDRADVCVYVDADDCTQAGSGNTTQWGRSHVIPAGPTIEPPRNLGTREEMRAELGLPAGRFLVGFFGFRQSGKGLECLANAMRTPQLSVAGAQLVLVGSPVPMMSTHRAASEVDPAIFTGLDVLDPGLLSPENVSRWLRACDVAALPYEDGLSTRRGTFMVAAAHGLPVVTTIPMRPDLLGICQGEVAFTPANDTDALAKALVRVRDDPAHRAKLESGSRAVSGRYSWPCIARQTLDAYDG